MCVPCNCKQRGRVVQCPCGEGGEGYKLPGPGCPEGGQTVFHVSVFLHSIICPLYRGADKSLARPTSRCILFDCENISFDASLVIYINSTNISPIMIINRIYGHQNLLSL